MSDQRSWPATGTTPMVPNFCAGAIPFGERQKPYLLGTEGVATCAKGIQNAHFSQGQRLTHSPAREEKHAQQEIAPLYTH